MKKIKVRAFGATKDIVGGKEAVFEWGGGTVGDLRKQLTTRFPELVELRSLMIAVNNEYAHDVQQINDEDEIALIPPVSGG